MSLRPHPLTPIRLHDERGFTLIEVLVAVVTSLVVTFAAFSILDISLSQSSRISDRVSADRRGRIAMEKIVLKLHSSCVAPETTPVEAGSEGNKLLIISQTGAQASLSKVELHEIHFEAGKLIDASYPNTEAKPAPNWEFSKTASGTQILLTGVTQSGATPVFQYFKYEGSKLSETALSGVLNEKTAGEVAAITVSFTAASESGRASKKAGERTVDLANTVVLRFSPASTSITNLPCA